MLDGPNTQHVYRCRLDCIFAYEEKGRASLALGSVITWKKQLGISLKYVIVFAIIFSERFEHFLSSIMEAEGGSLVVVFIRKWNQSFSHGMRPMGIFQLHVKGDVRKLLTVKYSRIISGKSNSPLNPTTPTHPKKETNEEDIGKKGSEEVRKKRFGRKGWEGKDDEKKERTLEKGHFCH